MSSVESSIVWETSVFVTLSCSFVLDPTPGPFVEFRTDLPWIAEDRPLRMKRLASVCSLAHKVWPGNPVCPHPNPAPDYYTDSPCLLSTSQLYISLGIYGPIILICYMLPRNAPYSLHISDETQFQQLSWSCRGNQCCHPIQTQLDS